MVPHEIDFVTELTANSHIRYMEKLVILSPGKCFPLKFQPLKANICFINMNEKVCFIFTKEFYITEVFIDICAKN